jgi:hypothetical protein
MKKYCIKLAAFIRSLGKDDWIKLVPALVGLFSAIVAIITAFFAHKWAVDRGIQEAQRKQKLEYLLSASTDLMLASHNPDLKEAANLLQRASIKIQFLGTLEQIDLIQTEIKSLNTGKSDLDPILQSLRKEVRKELRLDPTASAIMWTRYMQGTKTNALEK